MMILKDAALKLNVCKGCVYEKENAIECWGASIIINKKEKEKTICTKYKKAVS